MNDILQEALQAEIKYYEELENAYKEGQKKIQNFQESFTVILLEVLVNNYQLTRPKAEEAANEIIQKGFIERSLDVQSIYNILIEYGVNEANINKGDLEGIHDLFNLHSILIGFIIPIIHILRVINNKNYIKNIPNINVTFQKYRMTTEQIFETLMRIPKEAALAVIKKIDCSTYDFDTLCNCIEKCDKEKFINTIHENNIDIIDISTDCRIIQEMSAYSSLYNKALDYTEVANQYESFSIAYQALQNVSLIHDLIKRDENLEQVNSAIENCTKILAQPLNPYQTLEIIELGLTRIKSSLSGNIKYTPKEWEILNRILKDPKYADVYNEIFNKQETVGFLPEKYFELPDNAEERVCLTDIKPFIKKRGTEEFEKFINYIAEQEYIENNIQAKKSFAYRLTGRYKPDDLFEKIEWNTDKDPGSHRLYYIVKQFYFGNGRTGIRKGSKTLTSKYQRMKIFFICDEYTGDPTTYAKKVPQDFKTKLEEFFTKNINDNHTIPKGISLQKLS